MAKKKAAKEPAFTIKAHNEWEGAKVVPIKDARTLFTVEADDDVWDMSRKKASTAKCEAGAIVRLRPPADATDDDVDVVRKAFEKDAARVVVLPRPRAEDLPEKARAEAEEPADVRAAVAETIAEANSKDRPALQSLAEKIMAEEGI